MIKPTTEQLVPFNPQLIALLKAEHKEITHDCDLIIRFMKDDTQLSELNQTFQKFAVLLQTHWANERELYMYLEFMVSKSDGSYKDTHAEMRKIATAVNSTINLYTNTPISADTLSVFQNDFSLLTKALIGRMSHEERHLYDEYSAHNS